MAKPRFHEIIAIEGDAESAFNKIRDEAKDTFGKRHEHFTGHIKRTEMFNDGDKVQNGEDHKAITTTVNAKLDWVMKHGAKYFDVLSAKGATNCVAKADLIIDGQVIAENVPATTLLSFESKLKELRAMYDAIPTLPPGVEWEAAPEQGKHIFRTKYPEERFTTRKETKPVVLYPATDKHPAQVKESTEDVRVGKIIETKFSGMISVAEKSELIGRIDNLIQAVKRARQRANSVEVVKQQIGNSIFNYINNGILPSAAVSTDSGQASE